MRIKEKAAHAGHRTFKLMAQGDSWFDYPPGSDIAVCLHKFHGHVFSGAHGAVTNLAVAGSTLNDEAYGPVPVNLWGYRALACDLRARTLSFARRARQILVAPAQRLTVGSYRSTIDQISVPLVLYTIAKRLLR